MTYCGVGPLPCNVQIAYWIVILFYKKTSKKYWGQIRGQILFILIYGEFPRVILLILTQPNIYSYLSGFTDSRNTILIQGGLEEEDGGRRLP